MEVRSGMTVTLVEGPNAAANTQALSLLQSVSNLVVERVPGFKGMVDWVDTPCLRTPEGYVVSGVDSIKRFVERTCSR